MPTLTVTLAEHTAEYIEALLARGAIKDPAEYLESLVDQDWLARHQERIDALLLEGLNSGPPTPFTPQDWEDMRQRLRDRLAARDPS